MHRVNNIRNGVNKAFVLIDSGNIGNQKHVLAEDSSPSQSESHN